MFEKCEGKKPAFFTRLSEETDASVFSVGIIDYC
jgi:hypothetical protein